MKRFDVQSISDIPASPGADLGPKQDDEPGGDWPVRNTVVMNQLKDYGRR